MRNQTTQGDRLKDREPLGWTNLAAKLEP